MTPKKEVGGMKASMGIYFMSFKRRKCRIITVKIKHLGGC